MDSFLNMQLNRKCICEINLRLYLCFGAHAASAPNWDWASLQPSGSVRMNRKQVRFHRQLLCDKALEGEMQKFASTPPRRCWQKAKSQRLTDRLIAFGKKRQLKASVTENRWMQLPGGGRGALQPTWGSETKRRHSKERLPKNKEEKRRGRKKKEGIHEAETENQAVRWLETQEEMTNCEQMETCHVTVRWAAYGSTRMRTKWGKAQQQAGWLLYLWLLF